MIVFDDVEIPWENVFFHQHTRAAAFIRATLHRYSMFPFVQRHLRFADLLIGTAYSTPPRPASRCTRACARSWPSWPATARASTPT